MSKFYELQAKTIKGDLFNFSTLVGKPVMIVNVASKCGFTKQYKELEELNQLYKDKGLVIIGFPCNQFSNQEPGSSSEIESFCQLNFGVTFQMMEKVDVNGKNCSSVFQFLKENKKNAWYYSMMFKNEVYTIAIDSDSRKWNFEKFLVNKQGEVHERYGPQISPLSLKKEIEKLL